MARSQLTRRYITTVPRMVSTASPTKKSVIDSMNIFYTKAMGKITVLKGIAILSVWGLWTYLVFAIDPDLVRDIGWNNSYLPFYVLLTLAISYTIIMVFRSLLQAIMITVGTIMILIALQLGILTPIVAVGIITFLLAGWWLSGKSHAKVADKVTFDKESGGYDEKR